MGRRGCRLEASGPWLRLGGCERSSARGMPLALLGPSGSPCARTGGASREQGTRAVPGGRASSQGPARAGSGDDSEELSALSAGGREKVATEAQGGVDRGAVLTEVVLKDR